MSQTAERLVYMANQIAREFASQRPHDAVDATFDHLWRFWDPRMRQLIIAGLQEGGEGLSDIARQAVEKLATGRDPAPVTRATDFSNPDGIPMSDAG